MPFTFSHPALVLPLTYLPKKRYSLTGLVIGSVAPDFEYFLRMCTESEWSHTLPGLFWFDIPLGILLAFIYHGIVRDPLIDNLPLWLKKYLTGYKKLDWAAHFSKHWLVIIVSLFVGALSHVVWDGFTHAQGIFLYVFHPLSGSIMILGNKIGIYDVLQHSSTVVGLLVILYAIRKMPADKAAKSNINYKYWGIVVLITAIITAIKVKSGIDYKAYQNLIIVVLTAGLVGLVIASLVYRKPKLTS